MFRNQYDNDAITYSPQGRIFQVEYALEAIKQGSACVGLVSKDHAVLVALKVSLQRRSSPPFLPLPPLQTCIANPTFLQRNSEELGSYQKKIIGIDTHFGIALAGLAPDARVLSNFMRQQSLSSRALYSRPIPLRRICDAIAEKAQLNTQQYGRRPYGVGLLIAGVDDSGPHLFEFVPSGLVQEYVGCAVGARSQSARTYLEKHIDEFPGASREELVVHGLKALRDSLQQDKELNNDNISIAIVGKGKGQGFKMYEGQEATQWLDKLGSQRTSRPARVRQEEADVEGTEAPEGVTGDAMQTD